MQYAMRHPRTEAIDRARRALDSAQRVLVLTGAGMSADSGLSTYRGVGGLYEDAATEEGLSIEQALSGPVFKRNPALTWKYIEQVESACRNARPHEGHQVLAAMAADFERFCILTQNVDGFHGQAGSTDVIEMHGNIHKLRCTGCDDHFRVTSYETLDGRPPRCRHCGGIVRPDVVLFEEMLPNAAVAEYESALEEGFDAVLVIGTSALFPYIAGPVFSAARSGLPCIELNPHDTSVSAFCSIQLRGLAREMLLALSAEQ